MFPNNISILEHRTLVIENIPDDIKKHELREGIEYYLLYSPFDWDVIIDITIPFSLKTQSYLRRAYITMQKSEAAKFIINSINGNAFVDGTKLTARLLTWRQKY